MKNKIRRVLFWMTASVFTFSTLFLKTGQVLADNTTLTNMMDFMLRKPEKPPKKVNKFKCKWKIGGPGEQSQCNTQKQCVAPSGKKFDCDPHLNEETNELECTCDPSIFITTN